MAEVDANKVAANVLKSVGSQRSVIWMAQTDELCEQAVLALRQVWLNLSARGTDLCIVRMLGGNPNPAIQEPDNPVVMAASIQTLNSRMGANGLAELRKPELVVDECHHTITPSYTNLLRFLDAEAPRPGTPPKTNRPFSDSAQPHSRRTMKKVEGWPAASIANDCPPIRKTSIAAFVVIIPVPLSFSEHLLRENVAMF